VLPFIDVDVVAPQQLQEPVEPEYENVRTGAVSFVALDDKERDHYKILIQEYRTRLNKFEKREKALAEIVEHIHKTLALTLRPYIRGVDSPHDILQALKKRLAPTDRARRLQLAQAYHALKKAPRAQGTEHWLQQWETTYAEAEKLNLAEIQDHKALYDCIQASKAIDPAYANAY
jgi:hypothetical protein